MILQNKKTWYYNPVFKGYAMLMTVVVVGAVAVSITVSLLTLGLTISRNSFSLEQSYQAQALALGCAEEALEQIRLASSFTGSGALTLGQGSCAYTVTSQGGSLRLVTSSASVGRMIRKSSTAITGISPSLIIGSWQEVP